MSEKVSILIPVFNRKDLISGTIESALGQTYTNIEIVIIDNASNDGTWDIIKSYARKDSRIKSFQNKTNIGPVNNWKRCFKLAKGEYGKILFSDDLMESDYLEKALPYMDNKNIGFVFSAALVGISKERSLISYHWQKKSGIFPSILFIEDALCGENIPSSPCAALFRLKDLRKNLVTSIPSPTFNDFESHGAGPDFLLYLLTCADYPLISFISEPLVFFCNHEDSITTNNYKMVKERYYQAKLYFVGKMNQKQWMLNLLLHKWIDNISIKNLSSFSSFAEKYYFNTTSFTYKQWLQAIYFLIKRNLNK